MRSPAFHISLYLPTTLYILKAVHSNGDVVVKHEGKSPDYLEYCDAEEFEAKCASDHVIYMKNALYGRMRTGRCVDTDYGYVGCGKDVLHLADSKCSGRPHCRIAVPNSDFKKATDCPTDLKPYFEAGYQCLPVETAPGQPCQKLLLPSDQSGFLSNHVMLDSGKGSADCPWMIQGRSGQRINFTVYDFARKDLQNEVKVLAGKDRVCRVYAVIRERGPSGGSTVCSGNGRIVHAYLSNSHAVEVRILGKKDLKQQEYFLLRYQVIGCVDPDLPDHAWMEREGDVAVIGCASTNQKWRLVCDGNIWAGTYGNCSSGSSTSTFGEIVQNLFSDMSFEVSISIVVGIAVGIGIIILVCGIIFIRSVCRSKKEPPQKQRSQASLSPAPSHSQTKRCTDSLKKPLPPSPRSMTLKSRTSSPRTPPVSSAHPLALASAHPLSVTLPRSPGIVYTQETHGPLPPPPPAYSLDHDDASVTENEYAYISDFPPRAPTPPPPNREHSDSVVLVNPMNYQTAGEIDESDPDYTSPPTPYTSPRHSFSYEGDCQSSAAANVDIDPLAGYVCKNKYSFMDSRNNSNFSMKIYDPPPQEDALLYYDSGVEVVPYESQNGQLTNGVNYNCGLLESRYWRNKNSTLLRQGASGESSSTYAKTGTM